MIPALALCIATLCSDDMVGVLDNQGLSWTASPTATYYVVARQRWDGGTAVIEECASTNGTSIDVTRTECYADALVVKACKPDTINTPPGPDFCSDYNSLEPVEVLPFACVRGRIACAYSDDGDARNDRCEVCEYRCFPGAPRRLPNLEECIP